MSEQQRSDTKDSVVTVAGLDAGYGGVQILHRVSMTARTGEVTCIFGPNGCGKSTLLKAMVGVIDPWAGSVTIDGQSASARDAFRIEETVTLRAFADARAALIRIAPVRSGARG